MVVNGAGAGQCRNPRATTRIAWDNAARKTGCCATEILSVRLSILARHFHSPRFRALARRKSSRAERVRTHARTVRDAVGDRARFPGALDVSLANVQISPFPPNSFPGIGDTGRGLAAAAVSSAATTRDIFKSTRAAHATRTRSPRGILGVRERVRARVTERVPWSK